MNTSVELKQGDHSWLDSRPRLELIVVGMRFAHVRPEGNASKDWSGIYVQFDKGQAIR
jgi:hypothetical protein